MTATTATTGPGRIVALDVLRGVAILGTLGTNIWIFTDPLGAAGVLVGPPSPDTPAGLFETVLRFTANGKFLALLTILFGVGLALQHRSALRAGRSWPGWYSWRAALLLVEGTLHYVLIFEFDVLMGYALVAFRVAYLVRRGERAVRVRMWVIGSVYVAMLCAATAAMVALPDGQARVPRTDLYTHGSWGEQVVQRILQAPVYRLELVVIIPSGIVLFLLGYRLLHAGAFDDSPDGRALRRRLMLVGFGVGVPCNLATSLAGGDWALLDRYLFPPVVAVGVLGLVTELVTRMGLTPGPVRAALADLGKVALSGYVLQNLLASALCYGWGLGLAAELAGWRPWWVPVAWAVISVVLLGLARWWLRRFTRGPLEHAWNWAYLAPQRPQHARK